MRDVHQDNVGLGRGDGVHDLAAVLGLADDGDVLGTGEQHG
jgi:hypothetical protein